MTIAVDLETKTKKSDYKNCWIPVNTLPKKDGYYLVTRKRGIVDVIGFYEDGWYDYDDGCEYNIDDVIAWMEVPEPYKSDNK